MTTLIYGDNLAFIKKEVDILIDNFKVCDPQLLNFFKLEGTVNLEKVASAIRATPFLSPKKMVILKNIAEENDIKILEKIIQTLEEAPAFTEVFWIEIGKDQEIEKKAFFKKIVKNKKIQIRKVGFPQGLELKKSLEGRVAHLGITIDSRALGKILINVGAEDFDRMLHEIDKLALFAAAKGCTIIGAEDVEQLVEGKTNESVFRFLDFVSQKNRKSAFLALNNLIASGQNELYILSMLQYQFRNFYLIKEFSDKKISEPEMAKELKIHPFVIKKSRPFIKSFSYDFLKKVFFSLQRVESSIKRGKIDPGLGLYL